MNTHSDLNARRRRAANTTLALATGQAIHLGHLGGELTVLEGSVWLTRDSDPGDHRVEAGERLSLAVGENAVIERRDDVHAVGVQWKPRRQGFFGAVLAEPLRALAWVLGTLAGGFSALARSAAASASRAQGCISGGDSMASSGAVK